MNRQGFFTKWIRLVLVAAMATALGVSVSLSGAQNVAEAADVVPETLFEIDGNPDGPNDFAAPYPPGTTPGGYPTTGLYYDVRTVDQFGAVDPTTWAGTPTGCDLPNDDTALGGTDVGDGPVWPIGGPNPNSKTDLNYIDMAAEKVDVNGQIIDILYVGYEKCGGSGTWQTVLYLDDGDGVAPTEGDLDGDYLFIFDFNPSDNSVTFLQYRLVGGAWDAVTSDTNFIKGSASQDYGEVALNLTGLTILGNGGTECSTVVVSGQGGSITGGSLNSQMKDLVEVVPLTISNCGDLDVLKVSDPAGITSPDLFHYAVDQGLPQDADDIDIVHDDTLAANLNGSGNTDEPDTDYQELDANITAGGEHNWTSVISQPDYTIAEDLVPSGWALERIECTYTDIFVSPPALETVVIYETVGVIGSYTGNEFLVPPSSFANNAIPPASCTITNATSGVIIDKQGAGDATSDFTFDTVDNDLTSTLASPVLSLTEQSDLIAVTPGHSVTITETAPATVPAWQLTSVVCAYDAGAGPVEVWNSATNGGVVPTFDTIAGEVITCTFNNVQSGQIEVIKTGAPTAYGPFGFDVNYTAPADGVADFNLAIDDPANNSGNLAPGDYTVSELLAATNAIADPDFVGTALCSTTQIGSNTSSSSATGVDATITLGAGDIVSCTFTNTQNGRIIVEKTTINGDDTFAFTGAVAGSITTAAGVGTTTLSEDLAPGTYAVAETPTAGYTLTGSTCSDSSTVDSIGLAAGEIVTCSFENTRNQANFTLAKVWVDAIAGDTVTLAADGSDANAEVISGITAIAPAGNSDSMTVYSGETVDFSETFGPGDGANYITTLLCTDASGDLINNSGSLSDQLVIADVPSDITCTFTNSRRSSSLVLQKEWVDGNALDTAALTAGAATATSTASGAFGSEVDGTNQATVTTVFVGDAIDLSEVLSAQANYNTSLACVGGDLTYTGGDLAGSVEVLTTDENTEIVCTFTNTRKKADLVLAKTWDDPVGDSAVDLTITGGDATPVAGSSTSDGVTSDDATSVVYVGETLGLNEAFGSGLAANFDATLDCGAHAVTYTAGDLIGSITIGAADEGDTITCTFDNARKRTDLKLQKAWVNPYQGDSMGLSVVATDTDTDTAVAPAASGTDITNTADITVYAGESVALSEVVAAGNIGSYDVTAFSCSAGTPTPAWVTGSDALTVAVAAADVAAPITCTVENTRKSATFTLAKTWVDPVGGSALTLNADGDDPNLAGNITEALTSPTNDSGSMTVYSGETVNFDETFGVLADVARFTTTLECGGLTTAFAPNGAALEATFDVGADPVDTTCTFTNTRKSTNLELHKSWVDSAATDSYDLSIDATNDNGPITANAPGGTGDSTELATIVVYAGESATLTEAAGAGNVGSYDVTDLSCTAGQTTWTPEALTGSVAVDSADIATDPIVCTFTNDRTSTLVTLKKAWDDPAGGATVSLSAVGSDPDVGNSINGSSTSPTPFNQSMIAHSGETVDVTEAFTTGNPANYTSSLLCTDAAATSGQYNGTVTISADPTPITCEFTNTRLRTTLTLDKDWVGAVEFDEADLSIAATESDGPATAIAPDGDGTSPETASITVYAGETVTLSEAIDPNGTNVALYDATAFACTAGTENPVWANGQVSVSLDVAAADVATPITCTFTNTARRGDILIIKAIDGDSALFSFLGSWLDPPGFTLTPPADGTDQQLFEDVLVPKDGSNYSVAEADPGALYGTTVQCVDGVAGGDPSSPTAPTPGLQGSIGLDNDELVTCTFNNTQNGIVTIVKEALPELVQDFDFTGDFGPFTLDDDGVGDNFIVFSNVVPGTYSVAETGVAGWDLTDLVCVETTTNSSVDVDTATATIVVDPAEAITCTFTNSADPGSVEITKTISGPVDAGLAWSVDFTLSPEATPTGVQPITGLGSVADNTVTFTGLVAGTEYTVAEVLQPGWSQESVACTVTHADVNAAPTTTTDTFVVTPGSSVACTFDNSADPGSVEITKTISGPVDAGLAWSVDFTLSPEATPTGVQPITGLGSVADNTVTFTGLVAGTEYTVAEVLQPGWSQESVACTVTHADVNAAPTTTTDTFVVTPGSSVACTFDNSADPGSVEITKTISGPVDAGLAWSVDFTLSPEATPTGVQPITGLGSVADNTVTFTGLVAGTEYTVAEVLQPGWSQESVACTVTHADVNAAPTTTTDTFVVTPGSSVACTFDNSADPGSVSLLKTVEGVDDTFDWDAFEFTIAPAADPSAAQTIDGVGNGDFGPITWTGLVAGATYTITETPPTGFIAGNLECTVTHADVNVAPTTTTGTFVVTPGSTVSCTITNTADTTEVQITKTVNGGLGAGVAWEFDFTISPLPTGQINPQTASNSGSTSDTVMWANLIPGTTYTVTEVVPDTNSTEYVAGTLTCSNASGGLQDLDQDDQSFTFVAPLGAAGIDISCSVTNTAQSDVTYGKVVDSVTRDAGSGVWTISYLLTAQNAADAGTGVYDLADTFNFGDGVTIVDGSAAVANTTPGTIITNALFDGVGDSSIVTAESIATGATHTYEVSVDVTIAAGPDTDGDCISDPGEGTGFLNTMSITIDGGDPEITDACAGFATLTLVKDLINDDGGNGTLADFPLTAAGPATLTGVSGTAAVSSAVPAGAYTLTEQELVEGYTNLGWACTGAATSTSGSVTLVDGENATCTIVNDDEPVDLELTKDDDGIEAVAGGAPFDYTLSIQNIGTRDLDLNEPVTLTDTLPVGLTWVSFPANCAQAGQTLTCDIDPALLPAGGAAVVITATVQAEADAPSGIYVNKASVTTEDDPSTNPPCPALGDNNVDCEETPVDRTGGIQIIKTDDVADGETVLPGETYSYELEVTNTGVSTILPGLVVDDDLPAQLGLVSVVGGAGWSCNAVDPIECTYAPELAPGASAPTITVTVEVAGDAAGTSIVNVAEVIGAVDRDCTTDRLIEAFVPACNEVTDTDDEITPLNPNADLAIVKTADVAQIGAGGSFDWTLEITNNGPGTAVNVVIGDLVPAALTVTGVTSSDFDCGNTGNAVECTVVSLAVGESGTLTIQVTVPLTAASGTVTNVGTVESDTPDPDLTNNSDDASVDVVAQAAPTTTLPPVTLPPTGSNSTNSMVQGGLLLLALGAVTLVATRRRREDEVGTIA